MASLLERYKSQIDGVVNCYDRVLLSATLPGLCYADGMAAHLGSRGIRLFDYPRWAEPLRDDLRNNAERVAREAGVQIEFIRRSRNVRKRGHRGRGAGPSMIPPNAYNAIVMPNCASWSAGPDRPYGGQHIKRA